MSAAPMTWPDLLARPRPTGGEREPYGPDPLQFVDWWHPDGAPRATIAMIHGGCWQTEVADRSLMDWAAADLRDRGYAVANVEYRGVDRPGGGWPGTFLDVAAAADTLKDSPGPVIALGHSAGGHLALWLAARPRLPRSSPLWSADPLPLDAALCLGGLPDLDRATTPPHDTCGAAPVLALVGAPGRADPFADTSPAELAPEVPQLLINTTLDHVAPPATARAYNDRVGGTARLVTVEGEGHTELIAPGTAAWAAVLAGLERLA